MRLTLRTMLAHLCGLLEAGDARKLEDKIDQSERGQELAKRIPRLVSQRDLDAPRLESKAAGSDPSSVSEYLDGMLSPERTAEFDRNCLKSDRQLAEVASCFEILSIVHRKPAKVPSSIRQRIYQLGGKRVDEPRDERDDPGPQPTRRKRTQPVQPKGDAKQLTPHQRAAILEEYVDAPILKPANLADREKLATSPEPSNETQPEPQNVSDSEIVDEGSQENWFAHDSDESSQELPAQNFKRSKSKHGASKGRSRWSDDGNGFDEEEGKNSSKDSSSNDSSNNIEAPPREGDEIAAPPVSNENEEAEPAPEIAVAESSTNRDKPISEEVSTGGRRKLLPVIAVIVVGLLVAGGAIFATGSHEPILSMFNSQSADSSNNDSTNASGTDDSEGSSTTDSSDDGTENVGDGSIDDDTNQGETNSGITIGEFGDGGDSSTETGNPIGGGENSEEGNETALNGNGTGVGDPLGGPVDAQPDMSPNTNDSTGLIGPENNGNPGLALNSGENADQADAGNDAPEVGDAAGPAIGGDVVGRLGNTNQLLARFVAETPEGLEPGWYRLPADSPVYEQDQLLSFPSYRPQVAIGETMFVTLIDAAGLEIMGVADEKPELGLRFGRMIVETNGRASVEAMIEVGTIRGKITFADSDSRFAIRSMTFLAPGSDPQEVESKTIIDVIAVRGRVVWEEGSKLEVFEAGQSKRYVDGVGEEITSLTAMPYWIDQGVTGIDLIGSQSVSEKVPNNVSLEASLGALANDSHVEIRMLAAQCLSLLGIHQPCVESLSEDRNKSYWSDQIEWLRNVVARGAVHAEALRETMKFVDGANGERAYQLLLGYSDEQIISGGNEELVNLLESDQLMLRVLAIDNLLRITGTRGMYRPETPQRIRSNHVRTWRKRLEAGEIRYLSPPSPPSISGNRTGE